jgi:hypothetical protein
MYCNLVRKTGESHSFDNIERKLSPLNRIIYDQRESALSIIISCARRKSIQMQQFHSVFRIIKL